MNSLTKFKDDKGKSHTFVEYYKNKYNIDIKVPSAPLLDVKFYVEKRFLNDDN
jgi:hypothetical protein